MEKIKFLLSFALGLFLTSTTFKVLSNSLSVEVDSKSRVFVAAKITETADKKPPVSAYSSAPDVWKKIADIESEEKHYQNAIEALTQAINLQPKNASPSKNASLYVNLSEIYALANQYKEALTAIDQALQIESMNIDYLNRKVMLANWAREYDKVEDSYKRILDIDSKNQMALVGLKNIEIEKTQAKLNTSAAPVLVAEASAITTNVVAPVDENPPVLETRIAAEEEENSDKAISIYKEDIAKNSNGPDFWERIADIETDQKQYQNAIKALKNSINLQPKNAELYVSLSEIYAVANQSKEALAAIDQALQIEPMNRDALNKKVILANWAREYDKVQNNYKRILNIDSNNQISQPFSDTP